MLSELSAVGRIAFEYVSAGMSVIPILVDGTKAPALPAGHPQIYSTRLPTRDELRLWFGSNAKRRFGIGLKTGAVSGGLEVIDFDAAQTFWPWASLIPRETFGKLTIVETPDGWHAAYRCKEICGNTQLAMWEKPQSLSQKLNGHRECTGFQSIGKGVRIETRGEGGYVVAEGSPPDVHASGLPYVQAFGPRLPDVQYVSPEERKLMWFAAAEFHCDVPRVSKRVKDAKKKLRRKLFPEIFKANSDAPWVWFDVNGDSADLLRKHGWRSEDDERWIRPGKPQGISAILGENEDGIGVLTVFSTSAGVLAPTGAAHASYGPFSLLVALEFAGDRSRAARYVKTELMK